MTKDDVERVAAAIEDARSQRHYHIPGDWEHLPDYQRSERLHDARAALTAMRAAAPSTAEKLETSLRGFVRAWEALPGNRHYGAHEVQRWISGPMKAAVDDARANLAERDALQEALAETHNERAGMAKKLELAKEALERTRTVLETALQPRRNETEQLVCINQALGIIDAAFVKIDGSEQGPRPWTEIVDSDPADEMARRLHEASQSSVHKSKEGDRG